jgi:hypothetical protein
MFGIRVTSKVILADDCKPCGPNQRCYLMKIKGTDFSFLGKVHPIKAKIETHPLNPCLELVSCTPGRILQSV